MAPVAGTSGTKKVEDANIGVMEEVAPVAGTSGTIKAAAVKKVGDTTTAGKTRAMKGKGVHNVYKI